MANKKIRAFDTSDKSPASKRLYKNMWGGSSMEKPTESDDPNISSANMYIRETCLQNKNIFVDKPNDTVKAFNRNKYDTTWGKGKIKKRASSTAISEGTTYDGDDSTEKQIFVKTIVANDYNALRDIKYNIEAYKAMPDHISKIDFINNCDVSKNESPNDFGKAIQPGSALIVLAIEKMDPFEQKMDNLYNMYKGDPTKNMGPLEENVEMLMKTCDIFNSRGFLHRRLRYKNIGMRLGKRQVVLTDFTEATYFNSKKIFTTENEILRKTIMRKRPPFNSLLMCLFLYTKYKKDSNDTPVWVMYLLFKTCLYYKSIMHHLAITAADVSRIIFENFAITAKIQGIVGWEKIKEIPLEVIKGTEIYFDVKNKDFTFKIEPRKNIDLQKCQITYNGKNPDMKQSLKDLNDCRNGIAQNRKNKIEGDQDVDGEDEVDDSGGNSDSGGSDSNSDGY
jgi:hypothetical protein